MSTSSYPDTPEGAALLLMDRIEGHEKEVRNASDYRRFLLDLYAECLQATKNQRNIPQPAAVVI
jgi:hypothetical protein